MGRVLSFLLDVCIFLRHCDKMAPANCWNYLLSQALQPELFPLILRKEKTTTASWLHIPAGKWTDLIMSVTSRHLVSQTLWSFH